MSLGGGGFRAGSQRTGENRSRATYRQRLPKDEDLLDVTVSETLFRGSAVLVMEWEMIPGREAPARRARNNHGGATVAQPRFVANPG